MSTDLVIARLDSARVALAEARTIQDTKKILDIAAAAEIYAKRRDTKNYEAVATQAYPLTGANGPDWNRICEMGMGIDPTNKLYQPGGAPAAVATQPLNVPPATSSFGSTMPESGQAELAERVPVVALTR